MSFTFGNISTSSKKKTVNYQLIPTCIASDRTQAPAPYDLPVTVLLDEHPTGQKLAAIEGFLQKNKITRYLALYTCRYDIRNDEVSPGVISFYQDNKSDYEKYIIPHSRIITFGPALYSLLMEDDIYPSHCEQLTFGCHYFWASIDLTREHGHWVFPIDSHSELWALGYQGDPVDSYKTKIAQIQCKTVLVKPLEEPEYPQIHKIFIKTKDEFINRFYLPNKDRKGELAWDTETTGLNYYTSDVGCITLSWDGVTGYYINWSLMDDECKKMLDEIFSHNIQIGANLKFDIKFMWKYGLLHAHIDEDVFIMGHTLDETRSNSLKALAYYYTQFGGYERALDDYKKKHHIETYMDIDESILREYAVMDAVVTWRVFHNMKKRLQELDKQYPNEKYPANSLEKYYYDRRIPAANMYAELEYRGFCVNKKKLDALRIQMQDSIKDIKLRLSKAFGVSQFFDWGSSHKLGKMLEERGWEDYGHMKTGEYNTGDYQLSRWARNHEEARLIQELRSTSTLLNTFVGDIYGTKGWPQYMVHHPEDKPEVYRMHCSFGAMATESGRTRCSEPNLQNIPTRGKWTKEIKSCICTPDDDSYYLVTMDYAALELRLATIDSYEQNMSEIFRQPHADMHSMTSYLMFGKDRKFNVMDVTVEKEDGTIVQYLGEEEVFTKNRGMVKAKDLREDDVLAD